MDSDIAWEECVGDIPLDTKHLPPLNALSSTSSTHLPDIDLLELFSFDNQDNQDGMRSPQSESTKPPRLSSPPPQHPPESLSPITISSPSPTPSSHSNCQVPMHHHTPPSQSSVTHGAPSNSPPPSPVHAEPTPPPLNDQSQLVLELSTRLASAGAEATALRKRVAALSSENRSLRAALDHANARLVAVAQAAAAHPPPQPQQPPVMLGLAHMTTDMASRIAGAITVSDTSVDDSPRNPKKRKRMTGAATTMACVMFMWGALVGTPAWLSSSNSSSRSQGNLPAVWKGDNSGPISNVPVPSVIRHDRAGWQPNCMRVLEQLPDASQKDDSSQESVNDNVVKGEPMLIDEDEKIHRTDAQGEVLATDTKMFVDVEDKAAAKVVARSDSRERADPQYSYVLCRDAQSAISNVKACTSRMKNGEPCGMPHTISLIMPAEAAGVDDGGNETNSRQPALAEVQCSIMSVARIPAESVESTKSDSASYGRIIATVPETDTVVVGH